MIEIVRCQMAAAISRSVAFDLALFSPSLKDSIRVAKRSTGTLPCLSTQGGRRGIATRDLPSGKFVAKSARSGANPSSKQGRQETRMVKA
jgi:hypothetical protein